MEHEELTKQAHDFIVDEQIGTKSPPEQKPASEPEKKADKVK